MLVTASLTSVCFCLCLGGRRLPSVKTVRQAALHQGRRPPAKHRPATAQPHRELNLCLQSSPHPTMLEAGTLVAWNSEISHGRFRRLKWKTLEPRSPATRADHSCHHEAPPPSDAKLQISFVTGFIQEPEGLSMKAFMVLWTWKAGREPGGQPL